MQNITMYPIFAELGMPLDATSKPFWFPTVCSLKTVDTQTCD